MNKTQIYKLAHQMLAEHGLINTGWTFAFDNAVGRFAVCKHRNKRIYLSQVLTMGLSEQKIRQAILHEIAHALVGYGHGHSNIWRSKAMSIGGDGQRVWKTSTILQLR
jgi:hypothetical protein